MNPIKIAKGLKRYLEQTEIPEERLDMVRNCTNNIEAPTTMLNLKEERYPEISGRICGNCYCPLPTKLRVETCNCDEFKRD